MLVHISDSLFLFELEPWCLTYFVSDCAEDVLVRLCAMFQLVKRVLKLVNELPCQIVSSICQTGGLEIGDRTNLIPSCLHGNLRQVPPGARRLWSFVLLRCVPFFVLKRSRTKRGNLS